MSDTRRCFSEDGEYLNRVDEATAEARLLSGEWELHYERRGSSQREIGIRRVRVEFEQNPLQSPVATQASITLREMLANVGLARGRHDDVKPGSIHYAQAKVRAIERRDYTADVRAVTVVRGLAIVPA